MDFNGAVPKPQQLEKLWPLSANKKSLLLVARDLCLTECEFLNVLANSIKVIDELLPHCATCQFVH